MSIAVRWCLIPLLIGLGACGGPSVGQASDLLDPIAPGDDPRPGVPGERCNLANSGGADSAIRLVAVQGAALVRVDGQPVRLGFNGRNLRTGGLFEGEGVAVQIGGIPSTGADASPGVGIPVVVAVRRGDSVENFEGMWTCRAVPAGSGSAS